MEKNKVKRLLVLSLLAIVAIGVQAQVKVFGKVVDDNGYLPGAIIRVEGTNIHATSAVNGDFAFDLKRGSYTIVASYVGYGEQRKTLVIKDNKPIRFNFYLPAQDALDDVVVVGNRSVPRSRLDSPVDVIDNAVFKDVGQVSLNQILNYAAPSFNSNTQVIADATDHIDPASLRGLGPDQVLVLINGKRRHTTSMVNINGSFGKGSVGIDLNAIPTSAIKRIEILRDGASAQYGSDAIAGVINIILEDNTDNARINLAGGGYLSKHSEHTLDGETAQANANLGFKLGKKGGFINFAGSLDYRNPTNRQEEFTGTIFNDYNFPDLYPNPTGADVTDETLARLGRTRGDYVSRIGQSKLRGGALFINSIVPLSDHSEFYSFGGLNYRKGESAAFRRQPAQLTQNIASIYPDGFLPLINTDNIDQSLSLGIRGKIGKWDFDFSNTYGKNTIDFTTTNSLNASLLEASPTAFNAGGYRFTQNTTNFDLTRTFADALAGISLALGAEHRYEKYELVEGERNSYVDFGRYTKVGTDANGDPILIQDERGEVQTLKAQNGSNYAGGAQAFPGFRAENAAVGTRSSIALYADANFNITKAFLVSGALRFENYSDFGSTLTEKLSLRYKLTDDWSVRATASTGFRAPSLHQRYFSATSSLWSDGEIIQSGTFRNDSRLAQLLGIPKLKAEKSYNLSGGVTGRFGNFSLTVDGYFIRINDRIIYTGQFSGSNAADASEQDREIYTILTDAGASSARFFANAIDTETSGIDAVLTYKHALWGGQLRADLSASYIHTKVKNVHASTVLAGKEDSYLDGQSRIYIEKAVPREKINLSLSWRGGQWDIFLRNNWFGRTTAASNTVENQEVFNGRVVTDLTVGYQATKALHLALGANNLFDVYPARTHGSNTGSGYFLYSRTSQQFGFNGRYVFAKVGLTL